MVEFIKQFKRDLVNLDPVYWVSETGDGDEFIYENGTTIYHRVGEDGGECAGILSSSKENFLKMPTKDIERKCGEINYYGVF